MWDRYLESWSFSFLALFRPSLSCLVCVLPLLSVPLVACCRPHVSSRLQGFCNDKQVQLLWEADVARGEPDASEYWIRGFCQDTAYTFEEDDTTFLSCPFPVDFYSEVKINIPVLEEDLAMSEFVVTEKSCSDTCPNLFDIVCFVDNSCWRPIIIVVFLLTFSCVGVCLLVFLFMKKHKSLEQHVKNMRSAVGRSDARRNPQRSVTHWRSIDFQNFARSATTNGCRTVGRGGGVVGIVMSWASSSLWELGGESFFKRCDRTFSIVGQVFLRHNFFFIRVCVSVWRKWAQTTRRVFSSFCVGDLQNTLDWRTLEAGFGRRQD